MANEIYNIIMRVQGEEKVRQLTAEIAKEEKALVDLSNRLKAAGIAQDQIIQATSVYAQAIQRLNKELVAAEKQIAQAGGGMQRFQQGMIQAGYAVDDLQYGFKGIANNIQPLLMALGLGGGLAGIISIVVTGVVQLQQHWDSLMSAFGMGRVKTQAEEMDELAKATSRTVEQTAKLGEYQKLQKAAQALEGGQPKSETERQAAAVGGINEAGGKDRLAAGIRGVRGTGVDGLDPRMPGYQEYLQAKKEAENPEKFATNNPGSMGQGRTASQVKEAAQAAMKAARDQNNTASETEAKKMADQAVAGQAGGLDALIGEVRRNPGAFPPGALEELEKAHPKNIRARKLEAAMSEEGDSIQRGRERYTKEQEQIGRQLAQGEQTIQRRMKQDEIGQKRVFNIAERMAVGASVESAVDAGADIKRRERETNNRQNRAFNRMGGDDAVQSIADAMLMSGMSPQQAQRQLNRQLARSLDPESAKEASQAATQSGMANMARLREQMMQEAMGPRQISTGYASFKDQVMTSGGTNDIQRKVMEAGQKSVVQLQQITEILKSRTFATVVR